jgi:poly-gamma-glutamate capsule biosynthesis protein CapA/YwtB (metallophosphatase superfamily)
MSTRELAILAVGDVMIKRDDPMTIFSEVAPILTDPDVVSFGNCESTYAVKASRNPATRGVVLAPPSNVEPLRCFDAMSFANNHHLDAGYEAFFETIEHLKAAGIAICGAGKDLDEARLPAVVERNGVRVAFLGYSSILFPGYAADHGKAGCAPLRVDTHYKLVEVEQPGSRPEILTFTDRHDLARMVEDVERAKETADIVIVSPHWGIHFTPAAVADYETEAAMAAIDAGADAVLGHHQHVLKGVQVYKHKPIFHGMGNFAMDVYMSEHADSPALQEMRSRYPEHAVGYRAETPTYPFHPDARRTGIFKCTVSDGELVGASMLPCMINADGRPIPLRSGDPDFEVVTSYLIDISEQAGFDTKFEIVDDEIAVSLH